MVRTILLTVCVCICLYIICVYAYVNIHITPAKLFTLIFSFTVHTNTLKRGFLLNSFEQNKEKTKLNNLLNSMKMLVFYFYIFGVWTYIITVLSKCNFICIYLNICK